MTPEFTQDLCSRTSLHLRVQVAAEPLARSRFASRLLACPLRVSVTRPSLARSPLARSLDCSLARSLARPLARSLAPRSPLARSTSLDVCSPLGRSLPRSLARRSPLGRSPLACCLALKGSLSIYKRNVVSNRLKFMSGDFLQAELCLSSFQWYYDPKLLYLPTGFWRPLGMAQRPPEPAKGSCSC